MTMRYGSYKRRGKGKRPQAKRRKRRPAAAPSPPSPAPVESAPEPPLDAALEQRGWPIVTELSRIARTATAPARKLERALEILFGAYGESDRELSGLVLSGWLRAREDKQFRLTLAWQREQLRLSIADILAEGVAQGAVRPEVDTNAMAAIILGAAEGCLLQAATDGGAVSPAELAQSLLRLTLSGA
jgi:hypothetical protein